MPVALQVSGFDLIMRSAQLHSLFGPSDWAISLGLQGPCGLSLPSSWGPISIIRGRTNPTDPIHACQTYLSHHHHFSEAESDLVLNIAVKQKINTCSKMLELLLQDVGKQNDVFKDKTIFGQPARNSRGKGNIRLSVPRTSS